MDSMECILGHHMVVDAQSLIAFLKDIIEIYCNAMYEGVPFPKGYVLIYRAA